ncbi:sensor histidine kinase [Noviherbaspirillum galbum]|uniref:histidine kinase n=1 Tax=Noviherbaspirillum galbum TaxID=2709383 RepID=A0A6B3STV5_9BURK|nr:ATP-binding protein [Noviherbaspirillum galbum]NEX64430.1 PAS domain-containing protein [Noviherbaspirillum galbum]
MNAQPAPGTRETFWRSLQTFAVTRVAIAFVILGYLFINLLWEKGADILAADWRNCLVYLISAAGFALLSVYAKRHFKLQLLAQIVIDLLAISLLYIDSGGVRSGIAILYLFPLAGSAILLPMVSALFFDAMVTLFMLGESGYQLLHFLPDASLSRAGLYGASFFAASFVVNRLAAKLIRQEELAAQRGRDLLMQEAINRLVIADMGDGILVVNPAAEVLASNPAAARMLGLALPENDAAIRLTEAPLLAPIAEAFQRWSSERTQASASGYVMLKADEDAGPDVEERHVVAHLKLRFVPVDTGEPGAERTVIFVQDVTEIENRAQQLKLASMGRLTASIAHEVRNPLSAIGHAASLLKEDATERTQVRLLDIVGDNVVRLNRMIEDILKLSRKAHANAEPLQLEPFLRELLEEFTGTHQVAPARIALQVAAGQAARFDPLHLREVVVNLLSNALRYASGRDGSIQLLVQAPKPGMLELHVRDDGPAITPAVRAHLFEPFYTTSSKGTGLGLYVARELCLNNGAMLDYEYRADPAAGGARSGRFVISFAATEQS